MPEAIAFMMPAIVGLIGLWLGQKWSLVGLAICTIGVALISIHLHATLAAAGERGWAYYGDGGAGDFWLGLGIGLTLSSLALLGPAIFKHWKHAVLLSAALVGAFLLTGLPLLWSVCVLFGACI